MAGEQPVYLNISPEENLTNIRERLEQIPNRLIVLIVPRQTRLRNLHSWSLLRRYADDLGKEIWVISDDRPIIEVARKAQFRVGSPGGAGRGSNPGRGERSTASRREMSSRTARGASRFHQAPQARQTSTSSRRPMPDTGQEQMRSPLPQPPSTAQETDELHISNLGEDDEPEISSSGSFSSSFDNGQDNRYEQPFDFRIVSQSSIHPVEATPEPGDEEMDSFSYDYEQSQKIFQAAQQKDEVEESIEDVTDVVAGPDRMVAPHDEMVTPADDEQAAEEDDLQGRRPSSPLSASLSPSAEALEDPFAVLDDFQPLPLSEQQGTAPVHPFDDGDDAFYAPEYPVAGTGMHGEIEDMGDIDMDALPPLADEFLSPPAWEEPEAAAEQEAREEEEDGLPPPVPFRPRTGQLPPTPIDIGTGAAAFNPPDTEEEEEEIEDRPTRVIPPVLSLPDAVAAQNANRVAPEEPAAEKPPVIPPVSLIPSRQGGPKPVDLQPARASARSAPAPTSAPKRRPASRPARARKPLFATRRRRGLGWLRPLLIAVAVLLIAGIILFIVPSADVTVTLAAQSYSWPVVVSASTSQNLAQHTVPLSTATFTASVTQSGQASGANTPVGTAKASGIVQITNNGTQQVVIPSGTIVSTANNVLFVTGAELLVTAGSTLPVPVEAQVPGKSGNVAANAITVIPASSISQLEQVKENQGVTVKLSVTNPAATIGGGVGSATTVTQNDVSKLQSQASTQLYQKLQTWLAQQQARGNVLAQPVQKSQLAPYEKVKATPAAGKVASNGTFSETVSLSMPVKFVHNSDLQAQALAQYQQLSGTGTLPKGAIRPPKGYQPVAGQPVRLQPKNCSSSSKSSTANASTLCFTASAPVALPITAQQVQNLVNGRKVEVVRAQLANSKTGLPGIKAVKVNVSPGFWPWMPFWTQRIAVHFTTDIAH